MNQSNTTPQTPLSKITVQIWRFLRSPRVVTVLALILIFESLMALIIPQKPNHFNAPTDFVVWISNLSPFFQQNFQWLDALGLFQIFQSTWFWFTASLFSLSSLVALADILPATWQRLFQSQNSIAHSLSHTHHENIRLDAPQDAGQSTDTEPTIAALNGALTVNGYRVQNTDAGIVAGRYLWRWASPLLILIGILFLLLGGVIQNIWGKSNQLLLSADMPPAPFINHQMTLADFHPIAINDMLSGGRLSLLTENDDALNWQLGRWNYAEGWWIAPPQAKPSAQINFEQKNNGTNEQLTLVFTDPARPLVVAYSPQNISFELQYVIENNQPAYRLSIAKDADGQSIGVIQKGNTFSVPDLNIEGQLSLKDKFMLKAYKLPGLIPFLFGAIFLLVGAIQLLLSPPIFIHIKTVTKGRGSRVEIAIEGLTQTEKLQNILSKITEFKLKANTND